MTLEVAYALIGDGGSDRALLPIISWAIRHARADAAIPPPVFVPRSSQSVEDAIRDTVTRYEPRLVFVHRDAEGLSYQARKREIPDLDGVVPVIPVRMTEAWLLIDEHALRMAADNPNGTVPLRLPEIRRLETISDPKRYLLELLETASELSARRRRKFHAARATQRLAELIEDYGQLLRLDAFRSFGHELTLALDALQSNAP